MEKITTKFKIFFFVIITLYTLQGCNKAEPVVNPTEQQSGSFDININDFFLKPGHDEISYKIVVIDNDSIFFSLERNYIYVDGWEFLNIYVQSQTGHQYEFYASKSTNDEGNGLLPAGVQISNTPDSSHVWDTFKLSYISGSGVIYNLDEYANFDKLYSLYSSGTGDLFGLKPFWDKIPENQDRFLVFRILKNSSYQYYWIKVRLSYNVTTVGGGVLTVYNGKYQMNSITTGQ